MRWEYIQVGFPHFLKPENLARAVAFLCSPESSWIVGQTLVADGGLSLI